MAVGNTVDFGNFGVRTRLDTNENPGGAVVNTYEDRVTTRFLSICDVWNSIAHPSTNFGLEASYSDKSVSSYFTITNSYYWVGLTSYGSGYRYQTHIESGLMTFYRKTTAYTVELSSVLRVGGSYSQAKQTLTIPALNKGIDFTIPSSVNAGDTLIVDFPSSNSNWYYTLNVAFGNLTYNLNFTLPGGSQTLGYTIPTSWLTQIPNSSSGIGSVTVTSYTNSSRTLMVGQPISKNITIVAGINAVPNIDSLIANRIDNGVPPAWDKYIQGFSKTQIVANGISGYQGSTITKITISGSGNYIESGNADSLILNSNILNVSGTNIIFTCTVTDSRGKTFTKTISIIVVPYTPPRFNSVLTQRSDSSGNPATDGFYGRGLIVFSYDSVGGDNSLIRTSFFRETGATEWIAGSTFNNNTAFVFGGSFNAEKSYDVAYILTDGLTSITYNDYISPSKPILEVLKGGLGLAIGKIADTIGLDIDWTTRFRKQVTFDVPPNGVGSCPYAPGDVYVTVNVSNPNTRWPGTTWHPVGNGLLLMTGDNTTSTGGSNHLSTQQIPSHTHNMSHIHPVTTDTGLQMWTSGNNNEGVAQGSYVNSSYTRWGSNNMYTPRSVHAAQSGTVNTGATGTGAEHIHPYYMIKAWVRLT